MWTSPPPLGLNRHSRYTDKHTYGGARSRHAAKIDTHTCVTPLAHMDTRYTPGSRRDTHCLSTCNLGTGQAAGEGCGCWEPWKPISQEERLRLEAAGPSPVVRSESQGRGRAEMVPSSRAAGQGTGIEHPPYLGNLQGQISGICCKALVPPCLGPLHAPTPCQPRRQPLPPQSPRSPSPTFSLPPIPGSPAEG